MRRDSSVQGLELDDTIRAITDPLVLMRRIVDQALVLIPTADGAAVELAHDGELSSACAAGSLSGHVGSRLRLTDALSWLAVQSDEPLSCEDSSVDDRVDPEACREVRAVSLICVPLRRGGEPVGVLKITSSRPKAFGPDELETLTQLGEFISAAIGAALDIARVTGELLAPDAELDLSVTGEDAVPRSGVLDPASVIQFLANVLQPGIVADAEARRRIERVLDGSSIRILSQPIVDLWSGALIGVEALARFTATPERAPDVWFDEAHRVGRGVELEIAAVKKALTLLRQLPAHAYVAINVGPRAIQAPDLRVLLESVDSRRVVLELTEHVKVDDYPSLRDTVHEIRETGARLAIDDTGAGFASLAHILNLTPDIIKLDRNITHRIDGDPVRRSLAGALVAFAAEIGADAVAEGIQTAPELETVRTLGIRCGQGYLLGHPGPVAALTRADRCRPRDPWSLLSTSSLKC